MSEGRKLIDLGDEQAHESEGGYRSLGQRPEVRKALGAEKPPRPGCLLGTCAIGRCDEPERCPSGRDYAPSAPLWWRDVTAADPWPGGPYEVRGVAYRDGSSGAWRWHEVQAWRPLPASRAAEERAGAVERAAAAAQPGAPPLRYFWERGRLFLRRDDGRAMDAGDGGEGLALALNRIADLSAEVGAGRRELAALGAELTGEAHALREWAGEVRRDLGTIASRMEGAELAGREEVRAALAQLLEQVRAGRRETIAVLALTGIVAAAVGPGDNARLHDLTAAALPLLEEVRATLDRAAARGAAPGATDGA